MFNFKESLKKGAKGEERFLLINPKGLTRLDGRKNDFIYKDIHIELKSDSYGIHGSPNFFIEKWSDVDSKKPGGPFQALEKNNELFIYYYPPKEGQEDDVYFVFQTKRLVSFLNKNTEKYTLINIHNRAWITQGYKIPRVDLSHLYTEVINKPLSEIL